MRLLSRHPATCNIHPINQFPTQWRKIALSISIAILPLALAGSAALSAQAVPSVPVGQKQFFVVPLTFPDTDTIGSIDLKTQGSFDLDFQNALEIGPGYCMVGHTYNAGQSCNVRYYFAPTALGARYGAIVVYDTSGVPVITKYLQGQGLGQSISFYYNYASYPPIYNFSSIPVSGGFYPNPIGGFGLAVDSAGSLFLAEGGENAVVKMTPSTPNYLVQSIGDYLDFPTGVALDGAGNTYITELYGRVYKETLSNGTVPQTMLAWGDGNVAFGTVTVDGAGNVFYIGQISAGSGVIEATPDGFGGYSQRVYSTFDPPYDLAASSSIAVDGNENLFVLTNSGTAVEMIPPTDPNCSIPTDCPLIAQNLTATALAVDRLGDVYIANTRGNDVVEEMPSGGTYIPSYIVPIGVYTSPEGVAVDRNGNVYISNPAEAEIVAGIATPQLTIKVELGTIPFEGITVSSPDPILVRNSGTQTVTLGTPAISLPTYFNQVLGATSFPDCTDGLSMSPGSVCTAAVDFAPPLSATGTFSGTGTISSSAGTLTLDLTGGISTPCEVEDCDE